MPPASRPLISREVLLAFRRPRLEDALAELCAEQGYRATTIDHVSRRVGCARVAVYEQFENKADIFDSLLDRVEGELAERVENACAAAGEDFEARVQAGLAALLAWVAAEPASAWALFIESLCATPTSFHRHFEALDRFTGLLAAAAPFDAKRPPCTEELLVGAVASLLSELIRGGEAARAPELGPELLTLLRAPLAALPTMSEPDATGAAGSA